MRLFRKRPHAPLALRILTRAGCHLCERLKATAEPLVSEAGGTLTEVDVDSDPALLARFGNEIPVILDAEGGIVAKALDNADAIRRRLLG